MTNEDTTNDTDSGADSATSDDAKTIEALAHEVRGALGAMDVSVELELGDDTALLMAVHPQLNATIAVEFKVGHGRVLATLLLMLGDWESIRGEKAEVSGLLQLNARLMTCAVALVDVGDQQIYALARTVVASELVAATVAEQLEHMAWEYQLHTA